MCVKNIKFLDWKSSVFIDVRKGTGGPLNMARSLIDKGPPAYMKDRPDRRSSFCRLVVKIYLVKVLTLGGKIIRLWV